MNKTKTISILGLFIWFLGILFYFYECFLRVYTNTIADNIMLDLKINAEQFALVGSAYFISYAFMQIPVGILINKFGVRKLLIVACIFSSIGVFWFGISNELFSAIIARFLMGFGSSFAFLCLLVLALNWFPKKHFGFFSGLSQFLGAIGPLLAGAPLALLMKEVNNNWRLIFLWLGVVGLLLALIYLLFIKNKPKAKEELIFLEIPKKIKSNVFSLFKNIQILWIVLYTAIIYAPMAVFGTFWGTLYLQSKNFDKQTSAFIISMIWIGLSVGSPIIGKISDSSKRRLPCLIFTSFIGIVFSSFLIFFPIENKLILILCFLGIGIASSGQILSYATIVENVSSKLRTTIMGLNNTFQMLFAAIIPTFIGAIIHTEKHTGILSYATKDFTKGLSIIPLLYLISFLIATFGIKETFCRSQHEIHFINKN
ncbi:MAG: MFS transporter [Parachlamydiales bacterium]|nr:MFS transporter [Parachlamydiales bacterium]